MTWRDFSIYVLAHERTELAHWARTRRLAHTIYSSVVEGKKWKEEKVWWPMPIDEKPEPVRPPTPQEIENMVKLLQSPQIAKA